MAIDVEKIKETRERKNKLLELLEAKQYNKEELEQEMGGWKNKREKSVLFSMIKNDGHVPVEEDGILWVMPLDDYPTWLEEQKEKELAAKSAPKLPKNPQQMRAKAEDTLVKRRIAYTKAINRCTENPTDEIIALQAVIAQTQMTIAEIKLSQVKAKLIDAFELKDEAELDAITNLNDLIPEE